MAAVKRWKVISDGVYFGDAFFSINQIIPNNRFRNNTKTLNWLKRAGAIEETTEPLEPPTPEPPVQEPPPVNQEPPLQGSN